MKNILTNTVAQSNFKQKYKNKIRTKWDSADEKDKNTPGSSQFSWFL